MWSVSVASAGSASQRAPRAVAARSWCAAPRVSLPSLPPAAALSASAPSAVPLLATQCGAQAPWPQAVESACSPSLQHCSPSAALALPVLAAPVLHPAAQFVDQCTVPPMPTVSWGPHPSRRCRPQSAAAGRTLSAAHHHALPLSALAAPTMLPVSPVVSSFAVLATLAVPRPLCSLAGLCGTPAAARHILPRDVLGGIGGLSVVLSRVWGVPGAGCQALNCPVDPATGSSAAQRVRARRAARMPVPKQVP